MLYEKAQNTLAERQYRMDCPNSLTENSAEELEELLYL